jgi:transcriptional regulator with XRE-family HTH domain
MYPNLKLQLWKSGIRQNRLASMLGIDETIVSKIVNGFRPPSEELKKRIAEVLASDRDWLFEKVERTAESRESDRCDGPKQGLCAE